MRGCVDDVARTLECAGRAKRGPRRGSRAGVVVASTALWFASLVGA